MEASDSLIDLFHHKFVDMGLFVRKFLLIIFCFTNSVFVYADAPLQPNGLICEYIRNPLGIDIKQPRFTWNFISSGRNKMQSAYEIIVSDNEKAILAGKGGMWETGKINSDQNVNIVYTGKELIPFTKYYWGLKIYDETGQASSWSKPAWFETAMLSLNDWNAK